MNWNPFSKIFPPKKFLGIDIGSYSIKIVEISHSANKKKLINYGSVSSTIFSEKPFRNFEKKNILFSTQDIVKGIKSILLEAKIDTRKAIFSVPDFLTFFTNFELPSMKQEELPMVIQYEAKQHIPLPLKEVTLSWQIIKGKFLNERGYNPTEHKKIKVLLVAVSNEIINQYQEIARLSNLELVSLEAEVFSLTRPLVMKNEKEVIALVEVGARSTTCTLINNGILENSYSIEMSSEEFDRAIVEKFNINFFEAEKLKKEQGLLQKEGEISHLLFPLIDVIVNEVQKIFYNFFQKEGKDIQKVILAGGAVLLPGLKEYFQDKLKKEVVIFQPFASLEYPPFLEETLKEIGPSYAIAVGAALHKK